MLFAITWTSNGMQTATLKAHIKLTFQLSALFRQFYCSGTSSL